jgi:hypothetical protein
VVVDELWKTMIVESAAMMAETMAMAVQMNVKMVMVSVFQHHGARKLPSASIWPWLTVY